MQSADLWEAIGTSAAFANRGRGQRRMQLALHAPARILGPGACGRRSAWRAKSELYGPLPRRPFDAVPPRPIEAAAGAWQFGPGEPPRQLTERRIATWPRQSHPRSLLPADCAAAISVLTPP